MDARPILGVPAVRPSLLVDVSTAQPGESQTSHGACVVTNIDNLAALPMTHYKFDDDDLDDDDDDDDTDDENEFGDDEDEGDDEEDEDDDEPETWQVSARATFR